jgi:hypothetical protein
MSMQKKEPGMHRHTLILTCLAFLLITLHGAAYAEELRVGEFSSQDPSAELPDRWKPMTFSDIDAHTSYSLTQEDNRTVIRAHSRNAASALMRPLRVDPHEYSRLQWSWKVDHVLEKGDVRRKAGDDYAARIYVAFAFEPDKAGLWQRMKRKAAQVFTDQEIPGSALNYIWASNATPGTVVPSPFEQRSRMIVLQSGNTRSGQWIVEERNIVEDYKRAFGEEPPEIIGIGIMTDTDNTGEETTGYYGDIVLFRERGSQG